MATERRAADRDCHRTPLVVLYRAPMAPWLANALEFARKMFARESLQQPPLVEPPLRPRGPGPVDLVLGQEELPLDPIQKPSRQQTILDVAFGSEELPLDPVQEPSQRLVPGVFGSEELPLDPVPAPSWRRSGLWPLLAGREVLPEDSSGPPGRRSRWLAWLFRPERLDPS